MAEKGIGETAQLLLAWADGDREALESLRLVSTRNCAASPGIACRTSGRAAAYKPQLLVQWETSAIGIERQPKYHPRPMNGIAVAITVMNSTFASSGRLAMYSTASATWRTSMRGSTKIEPFACGTPLDIRSVISVAAFPISIWPQAILKLRPSSEMLRVSPVMACLVAV